MEGMTRHAPHVELTLPATAGYSTGGVVSARTVGCPPLSTSSTLLTRCTHGVVWGLAPDRADPQGVQERRGGHAAAVARAARRRELRLLYTGVRRLGGCGRWRPVRGRVRAPSSSAFASPSVSPSLAPSSALSAAPSQAH